MLTVLYLHGLGSNGNSTSAVQLKAALTGQARVIAPTYSPEDASAAREHLAGLAARADIIVGTSMGGWHAGVLAARYGQTAIVVNPCFEPKRHLAKYINQPLPHYDGGKSTVFTQDMLSKFWSMPITHGMHWIIGLNDELIPAADQRIAARAAHRVYTQSMGHRLDSGGIETVANIIKSFIRS
jgi:predicted esterase YcpF (UPF0227 family)